VEFYSYFGAPFTGVPDGKLPVDYTTQLHHKSLQSYARDYRKIVLLMNTILQPFVKEIALLNKVEVFATQGLKRKFAETDAGEMVSRWAERLTPDYRITVFDDEVGFW
jgi:hypothetical protein